MRTWRSPDLQAGERGAFVQVAAAGHDADAGAAEHVLAGVPGAEQERVVGGDHLAVGVEYHDAVIDAVDHGFQALALLAYLAYQPGYRIRHGVELARQPGNGVRTLRRNPAAQVAGGNLARGGLEALQPAQHGEPDHDGNGAHQQQSDQAGSGDQPAQVPGHGGVQFLGIVVQDQDAVDFVIGIVAAVAGGPVADRYHGAQHRASGSLDDAARGPLSGRIPVACLAGGRAHPQVAVGLSGGNRVLLLPVTVEDYEAIHPGLLAEACDHARDQGPVVLDHLMFERHADQLAFRGCGAAGRFQEGPHVLAGIEVSAARTGEHGDRGNSHGEPNGGAGEA